MRGASASSGVGRVLLANSVVFPPQLSEEEAHNLFAEESERVREQTLRGWCDAMLELLQEVNRGPGAEASPLEEVWHWLAANDRLTRSLSFADQARVADLVASIGQGEDCQEGAEIVSRWRAATLKLRQLQKESNSNAAYLRIVEDPLFQLASDDIVVSGALPRVVRSLLRSMQHIYCTSFYLKEHRMALLLHKILKVLITQASSNLVSIDKVAEPPCGFEVAIQTARQLRDAFQTFTDNYFISEAAAAGASKSDRRPATALGTQDNRTLASLARRKDSDLGWWRATVRTSLEHANHCREVCSGIANLLAQCADLAGTLPALRNTADPDLQRDAESFVALHSGLKCGASVAEVLDLKRRVEVCMRLRDVEDRVRGLVARVEDAGIAIGDGCAALDGDGDGNVRFVASAGAAGGTAEVLTLPGGETECYRQRPASAQEMQENIDSMREELQQFGSQLDYLGDIIAQKAPTGHRFAPPPRGGGGSSNPRRVDNAEAAEKAAGLEVARRSTWYMEPPPLLPADVPMIEVRHDIIQTTIHRCPSRPRTAHPRLFVTKSTTEASRPATAAPAGLTEALSSTEARPAEVATESLVEEAIVELEPESLSVAQPEEGDEGEEARSLAPALAEADVEVWGAADPSSQDADDLHGDEEEEEVVAWRIT